MIEVRSNRTFHALLFSIGVMFILFHTFVIGTKFNFLVLGYLVTILLLISWCVLPPIFSPIRFQINHDLSGFVTRLPSWNGQFKRKSFGRINSKLEQRGNMLYFIPPIITNCGTKIKRVSLLPRYTLPLDELDKKIQHINSKIDEA